MGNSSYELLIDEVKNSITFLSQIGCRGFNCDEENLRIINNWGKKTQDKTYNIQNIAMLEKIVMHCKACNLSEKRKNIFFGQGNTNAKLVFIGGRPFTQQGEKLLADIIEKGMKLPKQSVYITCIVKCFSDDDNSLHFNNAVKACFPFLQNQLNLIKPKVIVLLGDFAAHTFLKTQDSLENLRGRFFDYKGIKVIPTYSPDYLIKYSEKKKETWEDIKKVINILK